MKSLNVLCLILGLGLIFVLCPGCGKKKADEIPAHPVTVTQAYSTNVMRYIDTIGSCVSSAKVTVISQVSGQIMKIHFVQGQEVKAGDLLYTIDPRPYQASLNNAVATMAKDEAQLELNRLILKRNLSLAPGHYISLQDLDKYRIQVDMLEAVVDADAAQVDAAAINLDYCYIKSPVTGKTGIYLVNEGNVISANDPNGLVTIQTISPIYADFIITEAEMMVVRKLMQQKKLQVDVTSMEDVSIRERGELFFLDNEVNSLAGTVKVRAICQNQNKDLWPGQFINVRILLDEIKDAVLASYAIVQISAKGPFTFVVKPDSTVDLRPIKLGQRFGDDILIETGVKAGEQLVVSGQLMLRPDSRVKVVSPDTKSEKKQK